MQLIEKLQYHINRLNEGDYIWRDLEYNKNVEIVIDPTPKELEQFLREYPICKCSSNDKIFAFANGKGICHDSIDIAVWPGKGCYPDHHFSINRKKEILGVEYGSCEYPLCEFIKEYREDDPDLDVPKTKSEIVKTIKNMLRGIIILQRRYGCHLEARFRKDIQTILQGGTIEERRWASEDRYY